MIFQAASVSQIEMMVYIMKLQISKYGELMVSHGLSITTLYLLYRGKVTVSMVLPHFWKEGLL